MRISGNIIELTQLEVGILNQFFITQDVLEEMSNKIPETCGEVRLRQEQNRPLLGK